MSSKGILTGGRALTKLIQQDSALGTLIQKIINGVNSVATNTATSAVGKIPPPPSPNSINVTTPGGFMQVTVNHSSEIQKGIQYITHVGTDPDFVNPPIVVDHGSSRSPAPFALPAVDHTGTAIKYYVRTLAQYQGSDASSPTIFGAGAPTPITLNGATNTLQPGTGSGTGSTSGQQSLVGLGKVQRTSSGTNPTGGVQTGGGIPAPPTPSGTAGGDLSGTYPNPQVASTHLTAPLPVNQGGSGTTTPSLVAGTNVTITGSWPDQTVTVAGGTGTVTHTAGALTSGQLIVGNAAADIKVGDLTGDVTTSGATATTIAANAVTTTKINNAAVTLAKIANAAANSKLLGSGASGSGAAYSELTLGTNLSMSGTTLNAAGARGLFEGALGTLPTKSGIGLTTALNQSGTFAATDVATGIQISDTSTAPNIEGIVAAYPGTPFTRTALFSLPPFSGSFTNIGIVVANTLVGQMIIFGVQANAPFNPQVSYYTAPATFNSSLASTSFNSIPPFIWMQYIDNGTNITFSQSTDGINWYVIYGPVAKTSTPLGGSGFNFMGAFIAPQGHIATTILMAWI